jgi:hypothetical protein
LLRTKLPRGFSTSFDTSRSTWARTCNQQRSPARTRNGEDPTPFSNSNVNGFNNNPGSLANGPFINNPSTNLNGNTLAPATVIIRDWTMKRTVASAEKELKQAQEIEVAQVREYGSFDKS